jgi:hypothetical protein
VTADEAAARALQLVQADDGYGAREVLEDCAPHELQEVIRQADVLKESADEVLRMKGAR